MLGIEPTALVPFLPLAVASIGLLGALAAALLGGVTGAYVQHTMTYAREVEARDRRERREAVIDAWTAWRDHVQVDDALEFAKIETAVARGARERAGAEMAALNEAVTATQAEVSDGRIPDASAIGQMKAPAAALMQRVT